MATVVLYFGSEINKRRAGHVQLLGEEEEEEVAELLHIISIYLWGDLIGGWFCERGESVWIVIAVEVKWWMVGLECAWKNNTINYAASFRRGRINLNSLSTLLKRPKVSQSVGETNLPGWVVVELSLMIDELYNTRLYGMLCRILNSFPLHLYTIYLIMGCCRRERERSDGKNQNKARA